MLSINTNLAGLIAQNSLTTSTDKLNQAIERMTTGLKINHASDNAANYSISTNLTTQLSAYDIAADNVANGMDLVNYANDIISLMQDKAARLNALSTQARNGTYGAQSLSALNSEASAIMAEITRLYNTAEYNDISLFNRKEYTIAPHLPQAGASGFIDETALVSPAGAGAGTTTEAPVAKAEYNGFISDPVSKEQSYVDALTSVSEVTQATGFTESEYKIESVEALVKLAELTNAGVDTTDKTFYLAKDLDIGAYCDQELAENRGGWTPIGTSTNRFYGTFDGNGHVIKNLKIDRETVDCQGLFGHAHNGELKNIGIVNVEIKGAHSVGGLVGRADTSTISNSYVTGSVTGQPYYVGGLVGYANTDSTIINSYATGSVTGESEVGGLVGNADTSTITNSYATGAVTGQGDYVGGLVGSAKSTISNSYATGAVTGGDFVGGLVGWAYTNSTITNSYATSSVTGQDYVGGLVGDANSTISNSYATGSVTGESEVGGLVGSAYTDSTITNSYATGSVTGQGMNVGGLVGIAFTNTTITNSYATGSVTGQSSVGGLVGYSFSSITNSYATGAVTGEEFVGGLVGSSSSTITNSYATGDVTGRGANVGGLVGEAYATITNSYATGNVTGQGGVGGLVGGTDSTITNSYATGDVSGDSFVGGLVGGADSTIINSYATGAVTGQGDYVGGLVGNAYTYSTITNSYATGAVTGEEFVGGLVGNVSASSGTTSITDSVSYSKVTGANSASTGLLIGGAAMTIDGTSFGTLDITNCQARPIDGMNTIGGAFHNNGTAITFDLSSALAGIADVTIRDISTTLQVGIYGNDSCQLNFDTNFTFNNEILAGGIESVEAFDAIVEFEKLLSEKATQLGAVQNRLDSALESIEVNINNLTSSRSTIRDADIAEVSSEYIRMQILQQASATLMATANQAPAIALQLI